MTTEEIRPTSLSTFNEDQAAFLRKVVQSDTKELTALMDTTELRKSHIHEMYEQSFHATKEDIGPMFVDNSDKE